MTGNDGEAAAARHLRAQGWRIADRNYTVSGGELDLVARDGETLVFVEVKATVADDPHLSDRITTRKQRRLARAARAWVRQHRCEDAACRFDVVLVWLEREPVRIEHIHDAFAPQDWG